MIKLAFLNLFRRKTRTVLALLGIMIGVASIVVLVSIVDGLYLEFNEVVGQYEGLSIMQKDAIDQPFSFLDESFGRDLENVDGVNLAIPEIWYLPVKIDGKSNALNGFNTVSVYGLDVQKSQVANQAGWIVELSEGKSLNGNDDGFVLVGKKISDDFGKFVGSKIDVDGHKYTVKGVFKGESDLIENIVVLNLIDAKALSGIEAGKVNTFTVDLVDPSKAERVKSLIEFKFPQKVQVFSAATYSEQFGDTLGQFRLLVFFVAAVSAVVAGVGIANTILMSILDRVKEIGALKAVGWANSDVIKMVLLESLLIGIIGGVFGVVFGFAVDVLLSYLFGLNYAITVFLVLQAFGFAVLLGLVAGIYPAFRASKLDPVIALRGG